MQSIVYFMIPEEDYYEQKTVWNLIIQKPCAALSVIAFILIAAVLNVMEVLVLERFIENFSVFHWRQFLCFAVLFSGICAFYYIQTPFSDYLKQKISLQLRGYFGCAVIEKTACISVEVLENQALLARLQDKPENRYANGFFSILQIFGGALGTAGIFALILQNVSFFLPVILLIAGLTAVVFRLIGKTESLYIRQDRRFAGGVIIWLICCLTGVWLKRKNCLDILHTFRS